MSAECPRTRPGGYLKTHAEIAAGQGSYGVYMSPRSVPRETIKF